MSKHIPTILIYTIAWASLLVGADNIGPSDNSTVVIVTAIIATVFVTIAQAVSATEQRRIEHGNTRRY